MEQTTATAVIFLAALIAAMFALTKFFAQFPPEDEDK